MKLPIVETLVYIGIGRIFALHYCGKVYDIDSYFRWSISKPPTLATIQKKEKKRHFITHKVKLQVFAEIYIGESSCNWCVDQDTAPLGVSNLDGLSVCLGL